MVAESRELSDPLFPTLLLPLHPAKERVWARGFALGAGSSTPTAFRMPALELPLGTPVEEIMAIGPGWLCVATTSPESRLRALSDDARLEVLEGPASSDRSCYLDLLHGSIQGC